MSFFLKLRIPRPIRRICFFAGHYSEKALRTFLSLSVTQIPCVLCGNPAGSISLCRSCRLQLDEEAGKALSDARRCSQCGRPLLSEHGICTACRDHPLFQALDGVYPLFTYVLSKKKLLYSWKIARQHNLSEVFACYLAAAICKHFPDTILVPVPPRPGKIRKTGWDQIEDITQYLENIYRISVMRILKRTETVQQKKLSKEERAEHSKHSYVIDEREVSLIDKLPEQVVLLDDVITTGSTVTACAEVLKAAGVGKVYALSLFTVPG